jgi:cytochrome c oxidase assembly protein subunit 15
LRVWLILLFLLVVSMITVGGFTRLTDSGLSITEWRPISGALPPLSEQDWSEEFEKYKQIPEYQLQNKGMSLQSFKVIYWWEWGHRQLGRVVGLVWAIGFVFFYFTRKIPTGWTPKLLFLGALGGTQGAIGWWMVSSGLSGTMLDVASYRLATHLGLAFVILGFIAWFLFHLSERESDLIQRRRSREGRLYSLSTGLLHFTFLQILIGALVAGIDAGRNYIDWPLMAGEFFPSDSFLLNPWWRNFFEDDGLVQFMHRIAGYGVFILGIIAWRRSRSSGNAMVRFAFNSVLAMMSLQMVLGITTVLYAAPWHIAIVHQLGAVVLWVLILRARFLAAYPPQQSVKGL